MTALMDMAFSSRKKKSTIVENSTRVNIMEREESTVIVTSLKESMNKARERRELFEPIG